MATEKTALIVFAHPNPKSYCSSIRDITLEKLKSLGFKTIESDLYAMNFNPVLTLDDTYTHSAKTGLNISNELEKAVKENTVSPDVQAEIDKIKSADYIFFIAPTWWGSFPAILKGWLDRVLLKGAVFDMPTHIFFRGYLKGKKAMIVTTTGWPKSFFEKEGIMAGGQNIEENYWHIIEGTFAFCGMETLPLYAFYGAEIEGKVEREKLLKDYEKALAGLEDMKSIPCPLLNTK